MEYLTILSQAVEGSTETAAQTHVIPVDFIWEQIISLSWLQAVLVISFGAVYLLYGWRIFRILVVICFAFLGMFAGIKVGAELDQQLWGGIIGLGLLAFVSVPLMRWAVSALGAVAGGVLTGGIWYAFELPEKYILAGAIIGIVAGGMISFIIFKAAVMLFTSLGGSILIVTGLLSLWYHYENIQELPVEHVKELFYEHSWFVPLLLLVPTFVGIILQNKFIKGSRDWDI